MTSGLAPMLQGSVRGSENDVSRVKEATYMLLKNLCGDIAVSISCWLTAWKLTTCTSCSRSCDDIAVQFVFHMD